MDIYKFEFLNVNDSKERLKLGQAFYAVCRYASMDADSSVLKYQAENYPGVSKREILLMCAEQLLSADGVIEYMNTHARMYELYEFYISLQKLGIDTAGPEILLEFKSSEKTLFISKQNRVCIPRDLEQLPADIEVEAGDELRMQLAYAALKAIYMKVRVYDTNCKMTVSANADKIAIDKCVEFANDMLTDFDIDKDFSKRCLLYKYVNGFIK